MHTIDDVILQSYLEKSVPINLKRQITRLRLSSVDLEIEKGRFNGTERNNRKCKICSLDIEDEYHFILICPAYVDLRKMFIKRYYHTNPSMYKLIELMRSTNIKEIINLGKY